MGPHCEERGGSRPHKNSFTARYPAQFPSRVTVRLKSGQSFSHVVPDYPGFPTRPFTWEEISAKFDKLVTGHVGAQLGRDIKDAVRSLEKIEVSDLTKLLRDLN
jgi:2-methylcitrate dehydratase